MEYIRGLSQNQVSLLQQYGQELIFHNTANEPGADKTCNQ